MKKFLVVMAVLNFLVEASYAAFPTKRALPNRVISNNENWWVFRDDKVANRFYVYPRKLVITNQSLLTIGTSDASCDIVKNFYQSLISIAETIRRLANTALIQSQGLEQQAEDIRRELSSLREQKRSVKLELEQTSDLEKKNSLTGKLSKLEGDIKVAEARLGAIDEEKKKLEADRDNVDIEIQKRLLSLKSLRTIVNQHYANLSVSLEPVSTDLKINGEIAKELTLAPYDQLTSFEIISLAMSPNEADRQGSIINNGGEDALEQSFAPNWTVKAFNYTPTFLNMNDYPRLQKAKFPSRIDYRRPLTLREYCGAKSKQVDLTKDQIDILNITYEIPVFADSGSSGLNGSRIFALQTRVSDTRVKDLTQWAIQKPDSFTFDSEDSGDPLRFTGEGGLEPQTIITIVQMKGVKS